MVREIANLRKADKSILFQIVLGKKIYKQSLLKAQYVISFISFRSIKNPKPDDEEWTEGGSCHVVIVTVVILTVVF